MPRLRWNGERGNNEQAVQQSDEPDKVRAADGPPRPLQVIRVLGGHAVWRRNGVTASRTLDDLVGRIRDRLSFVLLYAPSFPAEDQTSVAQETEQLLRDVKSLWSRVQDVERRRWLDLLAQEILDARDHFERGDPDRGCSLIQAAEERLQSWQRRTRLEASFIGTSGGIVRKA